MLKEHNMTTLGKIASTTNTYLSRINNQIMIYNNQSSLLSLYGVTKGRRWTCLFTHQEDLFETLEDFSNNFPHLRHQFKNTQWA